MIQFFGLLLLLDDGHILRLHLLVQLLSLVVQIDDVPVFDHDTRLLVVGWRQPLEVLNCFFLRFHFFSETFYLHLQLLDQLLFVSLGRFRDLFIYQCLPLSYVSFVNELIDDFSKFIVFFIQCVHEFIHCFRVLMLHHGGCLPGGNF